MRKTIFTTMLGTVLLYSCGNNETPQTPANTNIVNETPSPTGMYAQMELTGNRKVGDSLLLQFTVYNNSTDSVSFTKYHTPFEGFISAFLTIEKEDQTPVDYIGAMAKRVMPPPAETYIHIPPGDSAKSIVDLNKGYRLTDAGKYKAYYNSGNISGIEKVDTLYFTLTP